MKPLAKTSFGRALDHGRAAQTWTNGASRAKPDIALIIADDLMRSSLAPYSDGTLPTIMPNLNALAVRPGAVVFNGSYSTSALCTPSRVSLLTGRYASKLWTQLKPGEVVPMIQFSRGPTPEELHSAATIPRMLGRAGYRTGFMGKWHTNLPRANRKLAASLCVAAHADPMRNMSCLQELVRFIGGFDHAVDVYMDNEAMMRYGHHPESMAAEGVRFVQDARNVSQPFFLWYASTLPHQPTNFRDALAQEPTTLAGSMDCLQSMPTALADACRQADHRRAPAEWRELRTAVLANYPEQVAGCDGNEEAHLGAAWLDATIRPLLQALEGPNTLVVFTADHGNACTGKGSLYEGGVRVPLLMHWSAHEGCAAWAETRPFTHLELMPTMAALAGVPEVPANADGRDASASLWPSRNGATCEKDTSDVPLFLEVGYGRAIVSRGRKLIRVPRPGDANACTTWYGDDFSADRRLSNDRPVRLVWKSFELHPASYCNETLLFDLKTDPDELNNLATGADMDALLQEIEPAAAALEAHVAETESTLDVMATFARKAPARRGGSINVTRKLR